MIFEKGLRWEVSKSWNGIKRKTGVNMIKIYYIDIMKYFVIYNGYMLINFYMKRNYYFRLFCYIRINNDRILILLY